MARGVDFSNMTVYLTVLFVVSSASGPVVEACPVECVCAGVVTVNCSGAGLDKVPDGIPAAVEVLLLDHNMIGELEDGAFANFTELDELNLSHNVLTMTQTMALSGMDNLVELDVSFNRIHTIEKDAFASLGNVKNMNLGANELASLPNNLFATCFSVENLDLERNRLTEDVFGALSKIPLLKVLDVSHNPLITLPYVMLGTTLQFLTSLQLNQANISFIDVNAFIGLQSLEFLYLADNLITSLNRETFEPLNKINRIDLSGNPLECSCDTKKFQDWLAGRTGILDPDVFCADPVQGGSIDIETGDLDFLCYANATTTTAPPTQAPPGDCDRDATLMLSSDKGDNPEEVRISWEWELIEDDNEITVDCREFKKDPSFTQTVEISTQTFLLQNLDRGENYVCCGLVYSCGVYSCVDFDTGVKDCPNVGFVIGMTVAGIFCAVFVIVVIIGIIYCIQKGKLSSSQYNESKLESHRGSNPDDHRMSHASNFSQRTNFTTIGSNGHLAPEPPKPRPPPLRAQETRASGAYYEIDPYEYIPADEVKKIDSPTSIGNPGYLQKSPQDAITKDPKAQPNPDPDPMAKHRDRSNTAPSKSKAQKNQEPFRLSAGQYLHTDTTDPRKPRHFVKPNPAQSSGNLVNGSPQFSKSMGDIDVHADGGESNRRFNAGTMPNTATSVGNINQRGGDNTIIGYPASPTVFLTTSTSANTVNTNRGFPATSSPSARPPTTAKSVDNLHTGRHHMSTDFNSPDPLTTRSSDPVPDHNHNDIPGGLYLPPAGITLPPKSRETILQARQRTMHLSSPVLVDRHAEVESTAV